MSKIFLTKALLLPIVSLCCAIAGQAHAATFTVTNTSDSGAGSLRNAIEAANLTSGSIHSIVFDLPENSTIAVLSELPIIEKPGIALGSLAGPRVFIDAQNNSPLLQLGPNNLLFTLNNVALNFGHRVGGGGCLLAPPASGNASIVLNRVVLFGCVGLRNDLFRSAQGAAMLVFDRSININDSVFELNRFETRPGVEFNVAGGALALIADSSRSLVIDGAAFHENRAIGGTPGSGPVALGGSLYVAGGARLSIDRAGFYENYAGSTQNTAVDSRGGAIYAEGSVLIDNTLVFQGGAERGQITVESEDRSYTLQLRNTSFWEVGAGESSVVVSNLAAVTVRNTTFARTEEGRSEGAELRIEALPGQASSSLLRISNSLFAGPATGPIVPACSVGANVNVETSFSLSDRPAAGCGIVAADSAITPQGIDTAADAFGGWVELRPGSAGIDQGNPLSPSVADWATCMTRDARGAQRPIDASSPGVLAVCDVGAVEHPRIRVFADGFESAL